MDFIIYDTYKRKKIPFDTIEPNEVKMYNCGPTVHDFAHIGNFRANCFADIIRRWLEVNGYTVHQVMNITDIDDKTIRKSREQGVSLQDYTKVYIEAFFEDLATLGIQQAEVYPYATHTIDEMVILIEKLLDGGYAYKAEDGSIYFKVSSFPEYGNLSGKRLEDLRVGERVTSDEYESKDDVRDFALWKAWDEADGDVFWETSLGKGRPGWHIECSAMSLKYLGEEFDLHTGGVDNIFPHHENEIAQSKCALGSRFAHHWMHVEYLIVEGQKMSKSLGNFFTLRDLLNKGYSAREIRYVLIGTHYRSQLNFSTNSLAAARASLERIDEFHESWKSYPEGTTISTDFRDIADRCSREFDTAMNDDLNVSKALAAVFILIREINSLANEGKMNSATRMELEEVWNRWQHTLGILKPFDDEARTTDVDEEWIQQMIVRRAEARLLKDWAEADRIRDELADRGIVLKDGPDGTTWKQQ